jgi:hypothetical protein
MELILKYLSIITVCGTGISFVIGLLKWIDQRNREQEQKTYDAFHKMVCLAAGVDDSGRTIKMVQQVAAIYQLQRYKQYAFASIPVLKLLQFEFEQHKTKEPRDNHLNQAIQVTIEEIQKR